MTKRLRYNISWTLIGNTVFAAAQWAIIVLIARIGSPEMVGSYALALAITAPIFMLANLNLRAYQATDVRDSFQFGQYVSVRLMTTAIAMCVVAGICLLGAVQPAHVAVVLAVASAKAFETISDATYGLFQRHEELDLVATSLMLRGCLGLVGMAGGLVIGGSLAAGAAGMAFGWLLVAATVDAPRSRRFAARPELRLGSEAFNLIRRAAPLGLVMVMLAISQNIPAYVIEYSHGTEQLGFYASVAYFLIGGRIISSAVSQSSSPRLAHFLAQGDASGFRRLLHLNLLLGFGLGLAGVAISALIGEQLLGLVYGQAYAEYKVLLICTMAAAGLGFPAAFVGAALTAARKFRAMVAVNALSLAVTASLCWWAIPRFGLLGAPLAVGIVFLLKVTLNMVVIEQFLKTVRMEPRTPNERA
jgi:O-antigen/teichoic acid export membrane protein